MLNRGTILSKVEIRSKDAYLLFNVNYSATLISKAQRCSKKEVARCPRFGHCTSIWFKPQIGIETVCIIL